MAKDNEPKRSPGIMTGFDKAALRRHVEDADAKRAPTQEELAAAYGADGDIVACARDFPTSIDDLVAGICVQDQRFLDQGRKLLKQLLRRNAAATPVAAKTRGRPLRHANPEVAPGKSTRAGALPAHAAGPSAHQRPTAPASAPPFDTTDYGDADLYGG